MAERLIALRPSVFWDITGRWLTDGCRRFGTDIFSQISVRGCQPKPRGVPEEQMPHMHSGGIMKAR